MTGTEHRTQSQRVDDSLAVATSALAEAYAERRTQPRIPDRLSACLVPLNGADEIVCETDDLAEGGIHVTVPVGYGIAVGQRFELKLAAPGASLGMGPLLTRAGHLATVVHSRLHVHDGEDHVGVGLRFDRPLAVAQAY